MRRKIIHIDDELCDGCGRCIPNCPEGALQIIEGKARLVGDLFCDGLGACIGECPQGAITVEEREAEAYDERRVMGNVIAQGQQVIQAHLAHLEAHGERELLRRALAVLEERGMELELPKAGQERPAERAPAAHDAGGCPGARVREFPAEPGPAKSSPAQVPAAMIKSRSCSSRSRWIAPALFVARRSLSQFADQYASGTNSTYVLLMCES